MVTDYDNIYRQTEDYFSREPSRLLKEYWQRIDVTRPALDLGAGQGRNSLFLARHGIAVDAIDPSKTAIDTIVRIAESENLSITAWNCSFQRLVAAPKKYGTILVFGLIQILTREDIDLLRENIRKWTAPGSLVFVTAWTTIDPTYREHHREWKKIDRLSYELDDGEIRTYLEPQEILSLFEGYRVLHHFEGLGSVHRHGGDGPPEQHGSVEAVFERTE